MFFALKDNKEYNYTISGKEGVSEGQIAGVKKRVDKIYSYFHEMEYKPQEVNLLIRDYSKLKRDKGEIVLDKSMSDFEVMKNIINYQFGDYINYGLMYGVMNDIDREKKMEFEKLETCTTGAIEGKWRDMFISYINFHPKYVW